MTARRARPNGVELALTVGGVLLVVAGLYLPWVQVNPAHEGPVYAIYLAGMEWGFQDVDLAAAVGIALLTGVGTHVRRPLGHAAVTGAGVIAIALPIWHAHEVLGGWGPVLAGASSDPMFVSASGAFVTAVGGLVLVLAGVGRAVGTATKRSRSPAVE